MRRQIRARLAAEIREGTLASGERLPTVRALARRLGVHRNTVWAAYRELERDRLVRAIRGSGVYVIGSSADDLWIGTPPAPPVSSTPTSAVDGSTGGVHAEGTSTAGVPAGPRRTSVGDGGWIRRPLLLVESAPGLRKLLARELEAAVGRPVPAIGPGELRLEPDRWMGHLLAVRPGRLPALRRRVPEAAFYPLPLAGGLEALARTRHLRGPGVIAVLTISATVRRQLRALLVPLRSRGIGLALPNPADPWAVERALRIAAFLLADAVCMEEARTPLADPAGRRPLLRLRVLREGGLAELWARRPREAPKSGYANRGPKEAKVVTPGAEAGAAGKARRRVPAPRAPV